MMTDTRQGVTAWVASIAAVTLALVSCGDAADEADDENRAGSDSGQSMSHADSDSEIPNVEPASPELPVTFTGDDGVEIEVDSLDSVFVLDEATMEIMATLGLEEHIGIAPEDTMLEEYASLAEHRTTATGSGDMTVEGVLAMEPTIVIGTNMARQAEIVADLQNSEIPATLIDRSQDPADVIRKTAELLGAADSGEELAQQLEEQLAQAEEFASELEEADRPRVMVLTKFAGGSPETTTAAGTDNPAHNVVEAAGGINTGAESGLERYQSVTAEGIVAAEPEVIIVAESHLEMFGGEEGIWEEPGLSGTPAEEDRRLIVMDDMELTGGSLSFGAGVLNLQEELFDQ